MDKPSKKQEHFRIVFFIFNFGWQLRDVGSFRSCVINTNNNKAARQRRCVRFNYT